MQIALSIYFLSYGMVGPGIVVRFPEGAGTFFFHHDHTGFEAIYLPVQAATRVLLPVAERQDSDLTTCSYLVQTLSVVE